MSTLPPNIAEIVSAFNAWYANDPHGANENAYVGQLTKYRLASMSDAELADFFFTFAREGGKVQSGGERTAGGLRKTIEEHSEAFRAHVLKPFEPDFDVAAWLKEIQEFKGWGKGISTIYLNRVDPDRFVIVNNKSIEAYQKLGYAVRDRPLEATYSDLVAAQRDLLDREPALGNLFRADAICEFLISTDTGKELAGPDDQEGMNSAGVTLHHTKDLREADLWKQYSRADWEFLLDIWRRMLTELGIGPEDPMLNMNLRMEGGRSWINITLKMRFVIGVKAASKNRITLILRPDADERYPSAQLKPNSEKLFYGEPKALPYSLPFDLARQQVPILWDEFIGVIREYISPGDTSVFRKHHVRDLYRLTMDLDFRKAALDYLLEGKGTWPGTDGNDQADYWIFQANPGVYDTAAALRAEALTTWKVGAHKDKIRSGDKFILWVTGKEAGCYALGSVTSAVQERSSTSTDATFYTAGQEITTGLQVSIRIDQDLSDAPVTWARLKEVPAMVGFKAGNQGTTFSATEEQFDTIKEMAMSTTDYFTQHEFDQLVRYAGENYDKSNKAQETAYQVLRGSYDKIGAWTRQVLALTFPEGHVEIIRKPTNQANKFERYQWAKIYPYANSPKELSYTLGIDTTEGFVVKVDTVGLQDNEPRRQKYLQYRGEYLSSKIVHVIPMAEGLEMGWSGLVRRSAEFIRSMETEYEELVALIAPGSEALVLKPSVRTPLNRILYGPPGTGKTYALKERYQDRYTTRVSALTRDQRNTELVQDRTWWEVAAMVLLDLGEANASSIMDHELLRIKAGLSNSANVRATVWGTLQMHTVNDCELVKYTNRQEPLIFNKHEGSIWEVLPDSDAEVIAELRELLARSKKTTDADATMVKRYEFVTFHQSFSYEDFIEGIKPALDGSEVGYEIAPGVFKQLCARAEKDPENDYAIFIDEINRGNVSAIFGELISLIEPDKRAGMANALQVKLPYSKTLFSVPSNVHLIGTMNTADRSVEALDTALRRRFSFEEYPSKPEKLKKANVNGVDLTKLLTVINARIEMLVDREHHIGHSYFMNWEGGDQEAKLRTVFKDNIVPLLQEYFFGDPVKVGMVLGPAFVQELDGKDNQVKFASGFKAGEEIEPRPRFAFSDPTDRTQVPIEAFIDICDGK